MVISKRTIYGFRFLAYLAISNTGKNIQLGEVAKHENISVKYLEKIVQIVKRAGLLTVTRGSKGGYKLSKSPDKINAKDLFYIFEGVNSISDGNEEGGSKVDLWSNLDDTINAYLSTFTLRDLIENREIQNMYYI
ncbi:MAG: Rrf2 family transcriptional regulator [Spirochaetaceae bacterium]